MGKIKKIGLFGGTFNPIHIGHLIIANNFVEEAALDEVVFIPASVSPFKTENYSTISSELRLKIIELSIADNPKFSVSDYEISKGGISYTYQTIKHFKDRSPETEYYWLIGGDNIKSFNKWKNYKYILDNAYLSVASRPDTFKASDKEYIEKELLNSGKILWLNSPNIEISSSNIRERIKSNKSIKYLVPANAEKFILENM